MKSQTLSVEVTDTNDRPRGTMTITVEFNADGLCTVTHDGQTYCYTGKTGIHLATGLPTREMATRDDWRLWMALDGSAVWED